MTCPNIFKRVCTIFKCEKRSLSTTNNADLQKSIQVTLLGAHTQTGIYLSFLLKQNPLLSVLHLQGTRHVKNMAIDLQSFDTRCVPKAYGEGDSIDCIRGTDLIVILPLENLPAEMPLGERVLKEGLRIVQIAKNCTKLAPRAIIINTVPPVSVFTTVIELIFKETDFYHPGRILGSAALAQVRANCLLGRYQDLDPQICYAPLLGGPDVDLAVPLFSKAKPVEVFGKGVNILTAKFRGVPVEDFPKVSSKQNYTFVNNVAESFGLNRLISSVALGICGAKDALANVYMRSNLVNTCKHLVSTVRIARGGVVHNYGIPSLTPLELSLLEKSALQIKGREEMAEDYVDYIKHAKEPSFKEKESREKELMKQTIIRNLHMESYAKPKTTT